MPIDYSKYPADWKDIRQRILERADHKCEFCGVENHRYIIRSDLEPAAFIYYNWDGDCVYTWPDGEWMKMSDVPGEYSGDLIRVVLTIAHLDHDTDNNDPDNLRALCQRCHLTYDAQIHAEHARETRRQQRIQAQLQADEESGQMRLFED